MATNGHKRTAPPEPAGRLLTLSQAAAYLGQSKSTFYKHWRAWGIPGYQVGKHLMFRISELDRWVTDQRIPA